MIEKCEKRALRFKVRDLSNSPFRFKFVVEKVIKPVTHILDQDNAVVEELETLFAFRSKPAQLSRGDLFHIIDFLYHKLSENFEDCEVLDSNSD